MADSFADLWNSSAPLKPSEPARKLGASPVATTASGDAFGDILSGSFSSGSSSSKLTIAEKAAKARAQVVQQPAAPLHNSTTWAGLDFLATSFSSPQTSESEPPSQGKSLWDLDDFTSSSEQDPGITSSVQDFSPPRSGTPGDFDFGDRENALLDDDSGSDNDILGDLARPTAGPFLPVCAVSATGQTCTDLLTLAFAGCHALAQATLPSTSSYWPNRRNGLLPYSGPSSSRLYRVGS
jgi:hypothetical protein